MKNRRMFLRRMGKVMGLGVVGVGCVGFVPTIEQQAIREDLYFVKLPSYLGKEKVERMMLNLNKKYNVDGKRFVAIALDGIVDVEVFVAKDLEGECVDELLKEIGVVFFNKKR